MMPKPARSGTTPASVTMARSRRSSVTAFAAAQPINRCSIGFIVRGLPLVTRLSRSLRKSSIHIKLPDRKAAPSERFRSPITDHFQELATSRNRIPRFAIISFLLLAAVVPGGPVAGQENKLVESIEVRITNIDVVVTDKQGNP